MSRSRREGQVQLPVPMAELLQQPIASALQRGAPMTEERYAHLIKALEATVTQQREQLQSLRHAASHHVPRPSNGARHDQRAMMRSRESDMSGVVNTADCSSADDDDDGAPRKDSARSSEDDESSHSSSSSSSSSILATRAPRTPHRGSGQQPSAQQQQHPTRAPQPSQSSRCPHCGHDGAAEPGSPIYKLPHDWRVQVDAYVRERLETYVEALDEKLARCMAKRLRRVTQENVEESVDRELQRCIQRRFYSAAELHPDQGAAEGPLHAMMRAKMRERAAGGSSSNSKERPLQRSASRRGVSGTESTYSTALMTLTSEDAVSNREPRLFDKLVTRRLPAGLAELEEAGIVRPPPPHVTKPTSVQADVIAVAGVLDRAEKELDARQRKLKENKHTGTTSTHHGSRSAVNSAGLSRRDPNAGAPRRDDADRSHTHHHHHGGSHGSAKGEKEAHHGGAATTTPATPMSRRIESKMDEAEKRLAALEAAVAAAELVHSANARQLAMPLDRDGAAAATDTTA